MSNDQSNIITMLNVKLHRLIGRIQGSIMTFGLNKGYFITIFLAIFSIFKLSTSVNPSGIKNIGSDLTTILTIIAPIGTAIYSTVSTIRKYRQLTGNHQIITDIFYKNAVISRIQLNNRQKKSGYELRSFYNGDTYEQFFISDQINERIINGLALETVNLDSKFEIVDELKNFVPSILKRVLASNKVIFNGKLIRMANDLYLDTNAVAIQEVRYFDYQCTNEIAFKIIKPKHSMDKLFYGEKILCDSSHYLFDLELSSCANIIGASTLVITKDKQIIITRQGEHSKANPGRYAPSGSGSVGIEDLATNTDFLSIIKRAMEREFYEECNVPENEFSSKLKTILIGYTRLIERGGKPDFFGISYLDVNYADIENKIRNLEHGITEDITTVKILNNSTIGSCLLKFCEKHNSEKKISIQLWIIAEILMQFEENTNIQALFSND